MTTLMLLLVFMAVMITIGVWGMKKTSGLNDFFLGGRSIGPWVSAVAYGTSYFSAVLFIGFAGKLGWGFGPNVLWIAAGNTLFGSLGAWLVLGRRTRRMSQNLNAMTMPGFLSARFNAPRLKTISALLVFVFLLPYSASIFKGLGHLFEVNFNISYDVALAVMILITGVYLVLGGYFAVTLTDFIQGIIMFFGSLAMIVVLFGKAGGIAASLRAVGELYPLHVPPGKGPGTLMLLSLVFMTSFGTWGLPQMVQKFYAIKNEKVIARAAVVTTIFALVVVFCAYTNGVLAHVFLDGVPKSGGAADFDLIIPTLLKATMPGLLMAVIMLLVLSASMSTLSSLVLVSASAVAIDLYGGRRETPRHDRRQLLLLRIMSIAFIVISYLIARFRISFIVTLMSLSWGTVAGAFMAPFLYSLYWKRVSTAGVTAGLASGIIVSVSLFFILGPDNSPIASSIAMIVPFAVVPAVTCFTPAPAGETVERAFARIGKTAGPPV